MPQTRHISNIYVMREPPKPITKNSFNETTVKVLVAEAYKDKRRALAYLGSADRVLKNVQNKFFVAEYKKKIDAYRMQIYAQSEMQAEHFTPPRVSVSTQKSEKGPQEIKTEELQAILRLAPVPA